MEEKYSLYMVNYLNTLPFMRGLENSEILKDTELFPCIPAECSAAFLANKADVALVPVAVLAKLEDYRIVTDYCIGCDGAVRTVALFSDTDIEDCTKVYLDSHSNTSNELVKILLQENWGLEDVEFETSDAESQILKKREAKLLIGDKAFAAEGKYRSTNDLGEVWKDCFGLPFVFAVWIAREHVSDAYLDELNEALRYGVDNIEAHIPQAEKEFPHLNLSDYYRNNIAYVLDQQKRSVISMFLDMLTVETPEDSLTV